MKTSPMAVPAQILHFVDNNDLTKDASELFERCAQTIEQLRNENERLRRENEALRLDVHFLDNSNRER